MKIILIISCLLLSLSSIGQVESWATKIAPQQEKEASGAASFTWLRVPGLIVIAVCCIGFGLNKEKAKHYEKVNKEGGGSAGTLDKMWSANKRCVTYALSATLGLLLWFLGDGPVPIIHWIKPYLPL